MLFHLLIYRAQGCDKVTSMSGKYNSAQEIINKQYPYYPTAIFSSYGCSHLIYVVMMQLNVFQKQVPILERYKQYTLYSVAAPRGEKY